MACSRSVDPEVANQVHSLMEDPKDLDALLLLPEHNDMTLLRVAGNSFLEFRSHGLDLVEFFL